ncbi:MAG: hypothetical protein MR913_11865 [Clostridiales bacterium]|nr:hypothetical protein [Clostridiales bacterium]
MSYDLSLRQHRILRLRISAELVQNLSLSFLAELCGEALQSAAIMKA